MPSAPERRASASALDVNVNRKKTTTTKPMKRGKRGRLPHGRPRVGGNGSPSGHQWGRNSGIGEPVADPVHGEQIARRAGHGLDLLADVLHVRVDRALVGLDRDA